MPRPSLTREMSLGCDRGLWHRATRTGLPAGGSQAGKSRSLCDLSGAGSDLQLAAPTEALSLAGLPAFESGGGCVALWPALRGVH